MVKNILEVYSQSEQDLLNAKIAVMNAQEFTAQKSEAFELCLKEFGCESKPKVRSVTERANSFKAEIASAGTPPDILAKKALKEIRNGGMEMRSVSYESSFWSMLKGTSLEGVFSFDQASGNLPHFYDLEELNMALEGLQDKNRFLNYLECILGYKKICLSWPHGFEDFNRHIEAREIIEHARKNKANGQMLIDGIDFIRSKLT